MLFRSKITIYLEERLEKLTAENPNVEARRGMGLMQGLVLKKPVQEVIAKCMEEGLIVISAGGNVLRLLPPLVIMREHVDEMMQKLEKALA